MILKYKCSLLFLLLASYCLAQCPGPAIRTALINLQKSGSVEGTLAGQIPLTDACGNQRYQQYTEIELTPIGYTPTATGNMSNISEFVTTASGDVWYIDWQGNGKLIGGGSSGSCDFDWRQISDNGCPDAITDSIYHQKYASIGARLVWPDAEFLVNDSISDAVQMVNGYRRARVILYDVDDGSYGGIEHSGANTNILTDSSGAIQFQNAYNGSPALPGNRTTYGSINAQDSTLQLNAFGSTRPPDTAALNNLAYFDSAGKVRKRPVSDLNIPGAVTGGNAINITSGSVVNLGGVMNQNTVISGAKIRDLSIRQLDSLSISFDTMSIYANFNAFGYRKYMHHTGGYGGGGDSLFNYFAGWSAGNSFRPDSVGYANTVVGSAAGRKLNGGFNGTATSNVFIGTGAGENVTNGSFNTITGVRASTNNCIGLTAMGHHSGKVNTSSNSAFFGRSSGEVNTTGINTFLGGFAGAGNTTGTLNVYVGTSAGFSNVLGIQNTIVGHEAGRVTVHGSGNGECVFIGYRSAYTNTTGTLNTFVGSESGRVNTTGSINTFIGRQSGQANTTGGDNTFLGLNSGAANTTGSRNTMIGRSAGSLFPTTGTDNIVLGWTISPASDVSNVMMLGRSIYTTRQNSLLRANNGFGTITPTAAINIRAGRDTLGGAPLKFTTGTSLTTPEAGAMEWDGTRLYITNTVLTRQTVAYLGETWNIAGNTVGASTSWLGTADNFGFAIRTNNILRGRIDTLGRWAINQNNPLEKLDVGGNARAQHFYGAGNTSIAAGAAAGTSPSISITGTDVGGKITLVTGTSPATDAIIGTITFANAFSAEEPAVTLEPCDPLAAAVVRFTNSSSTNFVFYVVGTLAASTQYEWYYNVLQ